MADPFIAEVRIFGFGFAPKGWAHCDGQLLPIAQHTALFSLLGTTYGGNGQTTFAIPDLRDRVPMQAGQGPGLAPHDLGDAIGASTVTLTKPDLPAHRHILYATNASALTKLPAGKALARSQDGLAYLSDSPNLAALAPESLSVAGDNQPHGNLMPFLSLNFCIALEGLYPPHPTP